MKGQTTELSKARTEAEAPKRLEEVTRVRQGRAAEAQKPTEESFEKEEVDSSIEGCRGLQ